MPLICEFFGIKILMRWDDHLLPHFHIEYGEFRAMVDIASGSILEGLFPMSKLKLVTAWCEIHREELLANWDRSQQHNEIIRIDPLS